jgi:hypothetical protein
MEYKKGTCLSALYVDHCVSHSGLDDHSTIYM